MLIQSLPSSCWSHGGGFSFPSRIASSKVMPYAARFSLSSRCLVFDAWSSRSLMLSVSFTKYPPILARGRRMCYTVSDTSWALHVVSWAVLCFRQRQPAFYSVSKSLQGWHRGPLCLSRSRQYPEQVGTHIRIFRRFCRKYCSYQMQLIQAFASAST